MFFEPMNFINNLHYLIKGEVGLFVALGIISLSIIILNKLSEKHWIIEDIKISYVAPVINPEGFAK